MADGYNRIDGRWNVIRLTKHRRGEDLYINEKYITSVDEESVSTTRIRVCEGDKQLTWLVRETPAKVIALMGGM